MSGFTITKVEDIGNDVLRVEAERDGETLEAFGHVSATTNHYDKASYAEYDDDDVANEKVPVGTPGLHLKPKAKPRAMTSAEVGDYARRLIGEAHESQARPVAFH